ncbi:uncharacterized protein [Spinacia oleracea]|uniref:Aminotransferase-like plant mobile domain-containing protein n=1 Tax=Spinacia oleracea TaxID=3562 RepID=A0ABM3QNG3_SPIOL|nr:uncharacterized protein LOC130461035 [Spinacia oleracea]
MENPAFNDLKDVVSNPNEDSIGAPRSNEIVKLNGNPSTKPIGDTTGDNIEGKTEVPIGNTIDNRTHDPVEKPDIGETGPASFLAENDAFQKSNDHNLNSVSDSQSPKMESHIPPNNPTNTTQKLSHIVDNNPPRRKRGRPKLTEAERAVRKKPAGKWVPGGPGRPPLKEGQSKAHKQHTSLRLYPFLVTEMVETLCPVRRNWVQWAGFGPILDLKITKVDRHFMSWLEGRWDWKRQVLRIRDDYEVEIDENMISWITGIPQRDQDFKSLKLDDEEIDEFENVYDTRTGINYIDVYNKCCIEENRFWFLRHFILLTLGSLFCMNKYNFT